MHDESLDAASEGLSDARSKVKTTRAALQAVLDAQEGEEGLEPLRRLIDRLERIAGEVKRVEGVVERQAVAAGQVGGGNASGQAVR